MECFSLSIFLLEKGSPWSSSWGKEIHKEVAKELDFPDASEYPADASRHMLLTWHSAEADCGLSRRLLGPACLLV